MSCAGEGVLAQPTTVSPRLTRADNNLGFQLSAKRARFDRKADRPPAATRPQGV